jgi:hypothetical protein
MSRIGEIIRHPIIVSVFFGGGSMRAEPVTTVSR